MRERETKRYSVKDIDKEKQGQGENEIKVKIERLEEELSDSQY